jgi:hypothetical protein
VELSQALKETIISRIESSFPQAVAVWTGYGSPDSGAEDENLQAFEVYQIPREDYRRFRDLVWALEIEVARPNGFSIVVHSLTPESTRKYRWDEHQAELQRRKSSYRLTYSGNRIYAAIIDIDIGFSVCEKADYSADESTALLAGDLLRWFNNRAITPLSELTLERAVQSMLPRGSWESPEHEPQNDPAPRVDAIAA